MYVHLSAKPEDWKEDSVIALTDGGETVLIVPAKVKWETCLGDRLCS